jgi:hypothetical protein
MTKQEEFHFLWAHMCCACLLGSPEKGESSTSVSISLCPPAKASQASTTPLTLVYFGSTGSGTQGLTLPLASGL